MSIRPVSSIEDTNSLLGPAAEVVFVIIFVCWVGPPKMKRGFGQKLTRGRKPLMIILFYRRFQNPCHFD